MIEIERLLLKGVNIMNIYLLQSKTVVQAEIDTACELADFYRHNVQFAMVGTFYTYIHVTYFIKIKIFTVKYMHRQDILY